MNDEHHQPLTADVPPPPPGQSDTPLPPPSAVPPPPSALEGSLPPPQHGTGAGPRDGHSEPPAQLPAADITGGSSSAAITLPSLESGETTLRPAAVGGPEHAGRGRRQLLLMAAVALVVVGLLAAGMVALFTGDGEVPIAATTPSTEEIEELETEFDTTSSEVAEQLEETATPQADVTETSVFELTVGTCFNDAETGDELFSVLEVPCSEPHDNEVYALITHPAGPAEPYPGAGELDAFAREQCQGEAFSAYVGIAYLDSQYHSSQIRPTEASWGTGDREIVCVLWGLEQLVGSAEGTAE